MIEANARVFIEQGKVYIQNFSGGEFRIETETNGIMKTLGEDRTIELIKKFIDKAISDTLMLANLLRGARK